MAQVKGGNPSPRFVSYDVLAVVPTLEEALRIYREHTGSLLVQVLTVRAEGHPY